MMSRRKLRRRIQNCRAWRRRFAQRRAELIALRGGCCEACGTGARLTVHHVNYDRFGGDELVVDVEILCRRCHDVEHDQGATVVARSYIQAHRSRSTLPT